MDDDIRPRGSDRMQQPFGAEDVDFPRLGAERAQNIGPRLGPRRSRDVMAGRAQQRRQPLADGAGGAGQKNPIAHISGPMMAACSASAPSDVSHDERPSLLPGLRAFEGEARVRLRACARWLSQAWTSSENFLGNLHATVAARSASVVRASSSRMVFSARSMIA